MLLRSASRLAMRRSPAPFMAARSVPLMAEAKATGKTGNLKPIEFAHGERPTHKTPETLAEFKKSIGEVLTPAPKEQIVEGLGYFGQRHGSGGITSLSRADYGPHRYDYGRPTMPKTNFGAFFYGFWEFTHILFVADKYMIIRQLRHIFGVLFCFFPMWCIVQRNKAINEGGPPWRK